jgi:hypothetical protein
MPIASYIKFQPAIEVMLEGGNLGTETYAIRLATAINTTAGSITEVANGNGYTTGGNATSVTSATHASGVYKLVLADPAVWTATGAGFSFRYAVLVGSTSGNMGAWDYGSSQAVAAGETVTVDLSAADGVLQVS